jgi:signal peptidase I
VTDTRRLIFGSNPRRTTIRVAVLALLSFILFKWVLLPVRAEGISMQPTYEPGTMHLVNRLSYGASGPDRGDVVAIRMPGGREVYIKRVVGLPGERVAIASGQILVDGRPIEEPYVRNKRPWTLAEIALGPDEYFVIGDNRGMNLADHTFGRAPRSRIIGRLVF